eukprot:2876777-Amphidinium_carterae.2
MSSNKSFCTMKVATVLDNSLPVSIMRKQTGKISPVFRRKLMTSGSSTFTRAPMTPKDVKRKYSKGLSFSFVLRKGKRSRGMCALRNNGLVSGCEATHCNKARELQTRLEAGADSVDGSAKYGYTVTISWMSATMVLCEYQRIGAKSPSASLLLD